jgi:probable poly-beta-1,6-N-acetyl-D-glucosamine export protein
MYCKTRSVKNKTKHKIAVDVMRITSILAVILIHTTTKIIAVSGNALRNVEFTLFLNQMSRFAVPLFFIISGFVLEVNYQTNEKLLEYFKKRINRIFIPFVFWSAIYYYFVYFQYRNPNFINSLIRGDASYQLYFIPALIVFYALFPLLHRLVKVLGNVWVVSLMFSAQIVILYRDYYVQPVSINPPFNTAVLNFFPFVLGILISRYYDRFVELVSKWKWPLLFGATGLGIYVFYEGMNGYLASGNYLKFYSQWRPSVLLYTMLLGGFMYWVFNRDVFNTLIVKTLSKLSFFVFFVHVIVLELVWNFIGVKIFQVQFAQQLWWDPIFFVSVSAISFSAAYLAHKIPYLSKITG